MTVPTATCVTWVLDVGGDGVSGDDGDIPLAHDNKDDTIYLNADMVTLGTVRFKGRCDRHAGFDARDGLGGIRGGCKRCMLLLEIHDSHARLVELIRKVKNDADPVLVKRAAVGTNGADERQTTLF